MSQRDPRSILPREDVERSSNGASPTLDEIAYLGAAKCTFDHAMSRNDESEQRNRRAIALIESQLLAANDSTSVLRRAANLHVHCGLYVQPWISPI